MKRYTAPIVLVLLMACALLFTACDIDLIENPISETDSNATESATTEETTEETTTEETTTEETTTEEITEETTTEETTNNESEVIPEKPVEVKSVNGKNAKQLYDAFVKTVEDAQSCKMQITFTDTDDSTVHAEKIDMVWAYGHMDVTVVKDGSITMKLNYASDYVYTNENGVKKKYKWAVPANLLGEDPRWIYKYHGYFDLTVYPNTALYNYEGEYYFSVKLTAKQAFDMKMKLEECELFFYFNEKGEFLRTDALQKTHTETLAMSHVNQSLQINAPTDTGSYTDAVNPGLNNDLEAYNTFLKINDYLKNATIYKLESAKFTESVDSGQQDMTELPCYSVDKNGVQMLWYYDQFDTSKNKNILFLDGEILQVYSNSSYESIEMTPELQADLDWVKGIQASVPAYGRGDMFYIEKVYVTSDEYTVILSKWTDEGGAQEYKFTTDIDMSFIEVSIMEHSPSTPDIRVIYAHMFTCINDADYENEFADAVTPPEEVFEGGIEIETTSDGKTVGDLYDGLQLLLGGDSLTSGIIDYEATDIIGENTVTYSMNMTVSGENVKYIVTIDDKEILKYILVDNTLYIKEDGYALGRVVNGITADELFAADGEQVETGSFDSFSVLTLLERDVFADAKLYLYNGYYAYRIDITAEEAVQLGMPAETTCFCFYHTEDGAIYAVSTVRKTHSGIIYFTAMNADIEILPPHDADDYINNYDSYAYDKYIELCNIIGNISDYTMKYNRNYYESGLWKDTFVEYYVKENGDKYLYMGDESIIYKIWQLGEEIYKKENGVFIPSEPSDIEGASQIFESIESLIHFAAYKYAKTDLEAIYFIEGLYAEECHNHVTFHFGDNFMNICRISYNDDYSRIVFSINIYDDATYKFEFTNMDNGQTDFEPPVTSAVG